MKRTLKLITSLSTLSLALSACGGEGESEGAEGESEGGVIIAAEGEGEGEGASEGESEAESEGAGQSGDPAYDDAEYFYRLGLVRGHLAAFVELYRLGALDMAATHAKHPESELYADLAPAFPARSQPGFADELEKLVAAVADGGDVEGVYAETITAIRENAPTPDAKNTLLAVSKLVSTAAAEFEIGVDEAGDIRDPHEYQDAYGFLSVSREMLAEVKTNDISAGEAIAVAHEQLELSLSSFDGLMAGDTDGKASTIYGAAARIEIAALGL